MTERVLETLTETDYDKLAQRIVAQGAGKPVRSTLGHPVRYRIVSDRINVTFTAEQFCHDWRVVGALMEKVRERVAVSGRALLWFDVMQEIRRVPLDADFPIAIALACLDSLENSNDS